MKKSVLIALFLILVAAFAGCLGDDVDPEDETETPSQTGRGGEDDNFKPADANSLEERLEAVQIVPEDDPEWDRPEIERDDWFLLSNTMSGEGKVSAFKMDFPMEALLETDFRPEPYILLDVAIALDPMGQSEGLAEDTQWMLLVLYEDLDPEFNTWRLALAQERVFYGAPTTVTTQDFLETEGSTKSHPAKSDPFTVRINYDEETTGDSIYFVLAAKGEGEFGMGVQTLGYNDAGISTPESPHSSWGDFMNATDSAPLVPERSGEATGLHLAKYRNRYETVQPAVTTITADMAEPSDTVPQSLWPYMNARDVTLSSKTDWGGWSRVEVYYLSFFETGSWTVEGSIHGEGISTSTTFLPTDSLEPAPRLVRATMEGPDPTDLENTITKSGSPLLEDVYFEHLAIGGQVEDFFGLPFRATTP